METCDYHPVNSNDKEIAVNEEKRKYFTKSFTRQIVVCSGIWMSYFIVGLVTGAPTVLIPQIRREANSTDAVTDEMASWLSSVLGIAGIPWVIILPILMYYIGRKWTFALVCCISLIGNVIFCWSTTVNEILISEIVLGVLCVCHLTFSPVAITEYTSPKYRGVFLTIKSATFFWGLWVSNAIGTFYHWKNISLLSLICCAYLLTIFIWPESPHWLASKGRFEDCAKAHRWLKGTDRDSELELETIINCQKEYLRGCKRKSELFSRERVVTIYKCVTSPEFYQPFLLCMVLFLLYYSSAKLICTLYAIDIVKKMTASEQVAYKAMLILDGVTVFFMYVGCGIARYFKRRTLFFTSSSIGIMFLFVMSLYFYLVKLDVLVENNYVSVGLLVLYTSSISVGPLILCSSLHGELVPMRYKSSLIMLTALFLSVAYTSYLKFAPKLFQSAGIHGAFLFYGLCTTFCWIILYKYLPETKDKTLEEIEDYFRSSSRQVIEGRELMTIKTYDIKCPISSTINTDSTKDTRLS